MLASLYGDSVLHLGFLKLAYARGSNVSVAYHTLRPTQPVQTMSGDVGKLVIWRYWSIGCPEILVNWYSCCAYTVQCMLLYGKTRSRGGVTEATVFHDYMTHKA